MSELFELLSKGGWLMVPIGLASVLCLAFFVERIWSLQRPRVLPQQFLEKIFELLGQQRYLEAQAFCKGNASPIAAILDAGIRYHGRSRAVIHEEMEAAGRREVHFLERFLEAIGAIATVAPLLGLLGTVTGMIQVFQRVVQQASTGEIVDAGGLANGIWEALITTAAGLAVAIPAYLAYRTIASIVDAYSVEMAEVGNRALEYLVDEHERPQALPLADASHEIQDEARELK